VRFFCNVDSSSHVFLAGIPAVSLAGLIPNPQLIV
jgi:hypothetical protein